VPFADQYGSQTSLVDAAASVFTSGTYSWGVYGSNTIANVSNTLAITYVDNGNGAYNYLRNSYDLTTDLVAGKKYRITLDAKYAGGSAGPQILLHNGTAEGYSTIGILTTSLATYELEFTAGEGGASAATFILVNSLGASNVVTIDNVSLVEIGCVADYDLAFANPTQSDQVQDRAGAADGTASSGVTQVTPLVQVNATAARIGNSQATPADGELLVSGKISSGDKVNINSNGTVNWGSSADAGLLSWDGSDAIVRGAASKNLKLGADNTNFVTIDSAGLCSFSNGITVSAGTANFAGSYLNVGGGYGATGLSISDAGVLQADGLATFSGGIVETGGVLKENLLTNSGFDVWSNSTLENVGSAIADDDCASDDTGDWTTGGTLAFVAGSPGHYTLTHSSGTHMYLSGKSVTAGKLYRVSFDVENGTASGVAVKYNFYDGSWYYGKIVDTTGSFATYTDTLEATNTTSSANIGIQFGSLGGGNVKIKNFTFYEVTPGCVAADYLAMDGWKKDSTLDIWRQHNDGGTNTKDGSFYALKTTTTATNDYFLWPPSYSGADHYQRFAGRTVTFGCWVKSSDASHVRLKINDGTESFSAYHTGGGAWEWLEVTKTIASTPTNFYVQALLSLAAKTAYFSQPMLVFGSAIGAGNYSRPSGEIVNCEAVARVRDGTSPLAADDEIMNLEALSSGKIPKGAKAVFLRTLVTNSSITSGQGVRFSVAGVHPQLDNCPTVNSVRNCSSGRVGCDSNGDIYQEINEAGATLSDYYVDVTAVELR